MPASAERTAARRRMSDAEGTRRAADDESPSGDFTASHLAELDRLRATSLLSAGLAHEVANPLLAVLSNLAEIERIYPRIRASMGAAHADRWDALADCLDQAQRGADAIADVIRDFQVFLRPASNRVERLVDPGPLVERAVRMMGPQIRVTAEFRSCISKTAMVKAPPSTITQIALNLLANATEALAGSDRKQGRIEVRLGEQESNVVLEVEDNGPGLTSSEVITVFEPHATSKTGTSLGLGLAICRALVERVGGTISFESVANVRTCFRVTLPIAPSQMAPAGSAGPRSTNDR
jgi:signal transduction histidine kinase